MNREEQLQWERQTGRLAAAAAFALLVLPILGGIYLASAIEGPQADTSRQFMRTLDGQHGAFITSAVLQGIGTALLAPVLWFLYKITRYRNGKLPEAALVLGIVGPLMLGVAAVLLQFDRFDAADEFFASGARTEARADDLLVERSPVTLGVGLGGALASAYAVIAMARAAMGVGLLSRFMGILGIVVGALYILGAVLAIGPVVQIFWVGALGFLFLGLWPGGRGPAWETGEAIPWPSQADKMRARVAEQEAAEPPPEPESDPVERPASRKRKRKR